MHDYEYVLEFLRTRDVLKVERTSRGFEQYGNLSEHLDWLKNEKSASMAYVFLSSNFHLVAFYATMSIRGIHIALNTFQRFGKYNIR